MKKMTTEKKLTVATTTIRELSTTDLRNIVGGGKKPVLTISPGTSVI